MRGKRICFSVRTQQTGITPADAGKTTRRQRMSDSQPGSPPRMRGKHFAFVRTPIGVGITPADAGKTNHTSLPHFGHWDHPRGCGENLLKRSRSFRQRDHPRGCGENRYGVTRLLENIGSPPRMRGKHFALGTLDCAKRITPADAGKTDREGYFFMTEEDHPRGCGENFLP